MRRSRVALLAALGVDNFGSGLFLPVVLLYVTRVVGLPLAAAGTVVALGTVAGLAVPPAAGRPGGPGRTAAGRDLRGAAAGAGSGDLSAAPPAGARGRYLAAFQYSFTVPGVVAPAVVALFSVAVWLPWLLVGATAGLAVLALRWLAGQLPAGALRPGSVRPDDEAGPSAAAA